MATSDANAPAPTGPEPHELLLKELDERNQNARAVMQGYLAWYTFFVTANITIIGLALINADKISAVRPHLSALFILVNVLAIMGTLAIIHANKLQNERMKLIIAELNSRARSPAAEAEAARPCVKMASPYPDRLIRVLLWMVFTSLVGIIVIVILTLGVPYPFG